MIDRGVFSLGRHDIDISSREASTTISLSFAVDEEGENDLYYISGFPRTLIIEDSARGKILAYSSINTCRILLILSQKSN
jgi:hypothetical protein